MGLGSQMIENLAQVVRKLGFVQIKPTPSAARAKWVAKRYLYLMDQVENLAGGGISFVVLRIFDLKFSNKGL